MMLLAVMAAMNAGAQAKGKKMQPAQVLDLQSDMIARASVPGWRELMKMQFTEDLQDSIIGGENPKKFASDIVEHITNVVGEASAFFVEGTMTDMITWAAAGLDSTDTFRFDEVPVERGFVYFENPLVIKEVRGRDMLIHAVLWTPIWNRENDSGDVVAGYAFYAFNDYRVRPDEIAKQLIADGYNIDRYGRWGFVGVFSAVDRQRVGPTTLGLTESKREEIIADGGQPHEFTNFTRLVHAYFLLLNQTIVDSYEAEIGRQYAKRAKRAGIPASVTVVRLRRIINTEAHGETEVEWHHQWIVRGHWRWQHVSKNHPLAEQYGDGYRARVWVRPHVKGPEDKPLHVSEKVYALIR